MGQPEVNAGIPSVVGPWIIQQYLSPGATRGLALSGKLITAQQAFELGIVNELVPQDEVLSRAHALARELAAQPPIAFRLTKQGFREASQASFDAAFDFADMAQTAAFASGEPQRMMEKFFAERASRKLE
jgi:enoyl-CoA hydratase/carnithine racemase